MQSKKKVNLLFFFSFWAYRNFSYRNLHRTIKSGVVSGRNCFIVGVSRNPIISFIFFEVFWIIGRNREQKSGNENTQQLLFVNIDFVFGYETKFQCLYYENTKILYDFVPCKTFLFYKRFFFFGGGGIGY